MKTLIYTLLSIFFIIISCEKNPIIPCSCDIIGEWNDIEWVFHSDSTGYNNVNFYEDKDGNLQIIIKDKYSWYVEGDRIMIRYDRKVPIESYAYNFYGCDSLIFTGKLIYYLSID